MCAVGYARLGMAQPLSEDRNIFEIEFCGRRLRRRSQFPAERKQVTYRCVVIHFRGTQLSSRSSEVLMKDFNSLRGTTASRNPCSSRNSER